VICRVNPGSEVLCRGLYRWGGVAAVVNWHVTNPSASVVVKSRSRRTNMRSRTQKRPGPPAQASLLLPDRGGRHELATSFSMLGWEQRMGRETTQAVPFLLVPTIEWQLLLPGQCYTTYITLPSFYVTLCNRQTLVHADVPLSGSTRPQIP